MNICSSSDQVSPTAVPEPPVALSKTADPKEDPIVESESVSISGTDDSCSVSVERNRVVEVEDDEATTELGLLTPPQDDEEVVVGDEFRDAEGLYASCCRWMEHFSESSEWISIIRERSLLRQAIFIIFLIPPMSR